MLPITAINNTDSIEKEFCVPFSKLPIDSMSETDKKMFLHITNIKDDLADKPEFVNTLMSIQGFPTLESLQNKVFTAKFCFRIKMMLLHICKGDLSLAYLYMIYVQYMAKKNPIVVSKKENITRDRVFVDFRFFCEMCFPDGFPNAISIQALFNSLYVDLPIGRKNIIEFQNCIKSIQFGSIILKPEINNPEPIKQPEVNKQQPVEKKPVIKQMNPAISNTLLNFALNLKK